MKKKKILILLKKNNESGGQFTSKAGLSNSANFLKKALEKYVNLHCELKVCVDALFYDKKPKRLLPKTPVLKHEDVLRYFATKNPKLIKARGSNDEDD